jgi:hypothetical protein
VDVVVCGKQMIKLCDGTIHETRDEVMMVQHLYVVLLLCSHASLVFGSPLAMKGLTKAGQGRILFIYSFVRRPSIQCLVARSVYDCATLHTPRHLSTLTLLLCASGQKSAPQSLRAFVPRAKKNQAQ